MQSKSGYSQMTEDH